MRSLSLLVRSLGWRAALAHLLVLGVAGALVAFVATFVVRLPLDQAFFNLGMSYSTQQPVDSLDGPGLRVEFSNGFNVAAAATRERGALWFQDSRSVALAVYRPADAAAVQSLLGSSLTGGAVTGSGAVIDEATLASWGLGVGATIQVQADDMSACPVTITAATRPFHVGYGTDASGLLMLPQGLCKSAVADHVKESPGPIVFFGDPGRGAPRVDDAWEALVGMGIADPVTLALLGVSLFAWLLAVIRTASQVGEKTVGTALTLVRLGVRPRVLALGGGAIAGALCLVGAVVATLIAKSALLFFGGVFIQPLSVATCAGALTLAAWAATALRFRRWPLSAEDSTRRGDQ